MRLVSLTCSNTEIVCAIGRGDWLVAVDDHSDFPPNIVGSLPRVGPDLDIDIEAVAVLQPDLVLGSLTVPGHERIVAAMNRRGLPWIAPEPVSLADVYRDIRDIGERLDAVGAAENLVDRMQNEMAPLTPAFRPRILVEWWPKPVIVPGKASWVTDLIALAGGVNPFGTRDVKSTPVTDDEVVAAQPDAVVISWCGVPLHRYRTDVVERRPAWQDLPALRGAQIHPITEAYLGRPGPRLVDGYRALRQIVDGLQPRV